MRNDESLQSLGQPARGVIDHPGIRLPFPVRTKCADAAPGGVPPMFAALGEARPSLDSPPTDTAEA